MGVGVQPRTTNINVSKSIIEIHPVIIQIIEGKWKSHTPGDIAYVITNIFDQTSIII